MSSLLPLTSIYLPTCLPICTSPWQVFYICHSLSPAYSPSCLSNAQLSSDFFGRSLRPSARRSITVNIASCQCTTPHSCLPQAPSDGSPGSAAFAPSGLIPTRFPPRNRRSPFTPASHSRRFPHCPLCRYKESSSTASAPVLIHCEYSCLLFLHM